MRLYTLSFMDMKERAKAIFERPEIKFGGFNG